MEDNMLKNQRGQGVIGCLIAILFLAGPVLLVIGSGVALYRGSRIQAQLDRPEMHLLHQSTIEETNFVINAAVPSKAIPGSTTWAQFWITEETSTSSREEFTISTNVEPPMFVTGCPTTTLIFRSGEQLTYESLVRFEYEVMDLEVEESEIQFDLEIESSILQEPETVSFEIPLDSDIARRRIIVNRRWQITAMIIGFLIELIGGILASS